MKTNILEKDAIQIMRGLAILGIILHNYFHLRPMGYTPENEMSYSIDRTISFFEAISNTNNIIPEFLSFFGWIGVAAFVFLSGYGLALKYTDTFENIDIKSYVVHSYLKLLCLMLPTMVLFMIISVISLDIDGIIRGILMLGMCQNLFEPIISSFPGAFWYFGMTFQLYLLFLLIYKRKKLMLGTWGG